MEDGWNSDSEYDDDYNYSEDNDDADHSTKETAPSSQVITQESLLAAQWEDLQTVMDLLSLKEHHARTVLIHYRWDVDKVTSVLVEKGEDQLYSEAGVKRVDHTKDASSSNCSSEVMCDICMEEVPTSETTTMDCNHCFCNNCWTGHFVVKINEGQSRLIRCMAHKCNAICDEEKIRSLVSQVDVDLAKKFDRILLESYIEDNRRVKWCPSVPHCGNAVRIEDDEYCEVECDCGLQFCFSCSAEAHSPCSCLMWKLWVTKCGDESETVNWITINTKPCPACKKLVNKDGGCNLVRCICGQFLCWLCGEKRDTVSGHSCGRYTQDQIVKSERAKAELNRYIHYHNRYKAHIDSLKEEVQFKDKIQVKISNLESKLRGGPVLYQDLHWVNNAVFRLLRARRALSCSYPFAFYMFGDVLFKDEMTNKEKLIKQNLFEDQQQQFEAHIEKLSMVLGEPFDEYNRDRFLETKSKIVTLCKIIDHICREMYECIENDLLGPLERSIHIIVPYDESNCVERTSKLPGN